MAALLAPPRFAALEAEVQALTASTRASVVAVRDGNGRGGAGIVWDDRTIISNHHVVSSDACQLVLADGTLTSGRVIARDVRRDLVAIEYTLDATSQAAPIPRRFDPPLRPGELVVAVGHPAGVDWAVTIGVLTSVPNTGDRHGLLRASVTLQPGNSGGPLLDARGNLIGINAMLTGPAEALAIPARVVERFVRQARQRG
jgi:serine protease Do